MSRTMLTRRDALKLAAGALAASGVQARAPKKVLVAGAGIGGLSCAWELVRRGHEVVVLEASERTGGHVFTFRDGLDDGLYADAGAEHFTRPGYERYWSYVEEFNLPYRYYPRREHMLRWIGGKIHTEEMLADARVLEGLGLNRREIAFVKANTFPELAGLYYAPYLDSFRDEYRPFDAGLNHLDAMTTRELFRKDGASAGALAFIGGGGSALQSVWHAAILKLRGVPLFPPKVYRLVGGNQQLPDTFVERLGSRVRLRSPVTRIEHGRTGVRVTCRGDGGSATHEGDYLVCAMSAVMLRQIPVIPAWPAAKAHAIANVPYYFDSRPIFQSRTKFWARDRISPNMEFGDAELNHVWSTCDEVDTTRGLIVGTATGPQSAEAALAMFRRRYPGTSEDVEKARVHVWATNPWASACERTEYRPGELAKFWPTLIEPQGRVHFVGAYADNLNWGMEAATRSGYRVAEAITRDEG
jgi:monoamine oxidase